MRTYEKQGWVVARIEMALAVLLWIGTLIMIILAVVSANTGQSPCEMNSQYQGVLMVAAIVHGIVFPITLGLLLFLCYVLLAEKSLSSSQCVIWFIISSVSTALNIAGFIFSCWFFGLPSIVYIIPIILISYRIWSFQVIKFLLEEIAHEKAMAFIKLG